MKIALCYFGFFRSFKDKRNYENHIDFLVKKFNADVFIYSPTFFYSDLQVDHYNSIQKEKDDNILSSSFLRDKFGTNIKSCVLYEYDKKIFEDAVKNNNLPEFNNLGSWSWRNFSLFFGIEKVISLKMMYEKKIKQNYDVNILMRPDLQFTSPINLNKLDLNMVTFDESHLGPVIGTDKFFNDHIMVSGKNINCLNNLYKRSFEYVKNGIIVNNETLIAHHLEEYNVKYKSDTFTSHIVYR